MKARLNYNKQEFEVDFNEPIDISLEVGSVKCFHAPDFVMTPFVSGDFVGSVKQGAPINFFNVAMNPHGNGTHTECLGHITASQQSVNASLKQFHFFAQLITVELTDRSNGDQIITKQSIVNAEHLPLTEALIIRTLPNNIEKSTKDYSDSNPPFIDASAMEYLVSQGVNHLLIDLPSVDREYDEGVLQCHHIFWNVEGHEARDESRAKCTITELIYVPDTVVDGLYLLNLQIPSLPLDAAPSKPILYKMNKQD